MANTTTSPNMGLPIPTAGQDPGPDWATNINSSLNILDAHNHSSGSGVQITPSGLDVNADLTFGSNNATDLRSTRFTPQSAPIAAVTDVGCLYESGVDLYYNDGDGNQVRITQSGSVAGASGTITGLPSGTASASFSGGTFTFLSATLTPAAMAVGPITLGKQTASSNTITIAPANALASSYNLTLPASLPASTNYATLDNSGNLLYNTNGSTGTGAVVLASSPTFSGTVGGVLTSGSFAPTTTLTGLTSPTIDASYAYYYRINSIVHVKYTIVLRTTSSAALTFISTSIPIATASLSVAGTLTFQQDTQTNAVMFQLANSGSTLVITSPTFTSLVMQGDSNGILNFDYMYSIS